MAEEKLPQTILDLISEIGERMVLFKLYQLAHESESLEIFKNYSELGYDIGIRNNKNGRKAKVEVKTRQRLITTGRSDGKAQFTLTEGERTRADFLIGYWLEYNDFFIVPVSQLEKVKSGERYIYRFIAKRLKSTKDYNPNTKNWLNQWSLIETHLKQPKVKAVRIKPRNSKLQNAIA